MRRDRWQGDSINLVGAIALVWLAVRALFWLYG